jgi:hypothetical protein
MLHNSSSSFSPTDTLTSISKCPFPHCLRELLLRPPLPQLSNRIPDREWHWYQGGIDRLRRARLAASIPTYETGSRRVLRPSQKSTSKSSSSNSYAGDRCRNSEWNTSIEVDSAHLRGRGGSSGYFDMENKKQKENKRERGELRSLEALVEDGEGEKISKGWARTRNLFAANAGATRQHTIATKFRSPRQ